MAYEFAPILDLTDPAVMLQRMAAATAARQGHWFWLPCPLCGMEFGGQEWQRGDAEHPSSIMTGPPGPVMSGAGICPPCTWAGRAKGRGF